MSMEEMRRGRELELGLPTSQARKKEAPNFLSNETKRISTSTSKFMDIGHLGLRIAFQCLKTKNIHKLKVNKLNSLLTNHKPPPSRGSKIFLAPPFAFAKRTQAFDNDRLHQYNVNSHVELHYHRKQRCGITNGRYSLFIRSRTLKMGSTV